VTGFGSFDNSTCKRVLDLLEPGDLRLGQVMIKIVVLKLGVNSGSDGSAGCFVIELWMGAAGMDAVKNIASSKVIIYTVQCTLKIIWLTDTSDPRQFGPKTLRHQDISVLLLRQFGP